jgi:hypothetical protein
MAQFTKGDILYHKTENEYHIIKLLRFDALFNIYHIQVYQPSKESPSIEKFPNVLNRKILTIYMPVEQIDEFSFLMNEPVSEEELTGYYEYLKQTNFSGYITEKHLNLEEIVQNARFI